MKTLNITHLYPDLLNLYGDKGNIQSLVMRAKWQDISVLVQTVCETDAFDLKDADILVLGGGADKEQAIVAQKLRENKEALKAYVDNGGVVLATCGGFEMLCRRFPSGDTMQEGAGILDLEAEAAPERFIGDVVMECVIDGEPFKVVGFENHGSRIHIGNYAPLGKVLAGNGNDGTGQEGVLYKNVFATFLHGPVLPKNFQLTHAVLRRAFLQKYGQAPQFSENNTDMERAACETVQSRLLK